MLFGNDLVVLLGVATPHDITGLRHCFRQSINLPLEHPSKMRTASWGFFKGLNIKAYCRPFRIVVDNFYS